MIARINLRSFSILPCSRTTLLFPELNSADVVMGAVFHLQAAARFSSATQMSHVTFVAAHGTFRYDNN
jgi:hypothetical protein